MKQFISDHFAVLVVMTVFFALFTAYMVEIHFGKAPTALDWLEGEMKETIAAILMGLTGGAARTLVNGQGQRSGDAKPPAG